MSRFAASRRVNLVGAPWCEGLNYAGVDLAPVALREAGLGEAVQGLGMDFQDCGDVDFSVVFKQACRSRKHQSRDSTDMYRRWLGSGSSVNFATWSRSQDGVGCSPGSKSPEAFPVEQRRHQGGIVNLDVMGPGLKLVHDAVARAAARDDFVLTVGGDHSIATGTVCALRAKHPELGVLWINAHADANTPRISPSGHYHGMAAAHLLGWFDKPGECGDGKKAAGLPGFEWLPPDGCLPERKLAYIALRDVDDEEGKYLRRSGAAVFTMRDVDKYGIVEVCQMAIKALDASMQCPIHLSLDIDAVDPFYARGTVRAAGTRGGLTYREVHCICEEAHLTRRLVSMDLVEVDPSLDEPPVQEDAMHGDNPDLKPASPTVRLGVELVLSALGKQTC